MPLERHLLDSRPVFRLDGPTAPAERPSFATRAPASTAQRRLEAGGVLVLPELPFELGLADPSRIAAACDERMKSVSFDPAGRTLKGAARDEGARAWLLAVLEAFTVWSVALIRERLPAYAPFLALGKASFRPRPPEAALSPRKDDRRIHVDAFPAQPVQGRRILRVFHNVNPWGEARVWQVGEPFADFAARLLPQVQPPATPGWLLQAAGLTRGRRTAYDALMLGLHDAAKASESYQAEAPRRTLPFPPAATWLVFTDATPHALVSGRFALEQTFFLPVEAMADPEASPLRILERMTGRRLI